MLCKVWTCGFLYYTLATSALPISCLQLSRVNTQIKALYFLVDTPNAMSRSRCQYISGNQR